MSQVLRKSAPQSLDCKCQLNQLPTLSPILSVIYVRHLTSPSSSTSEIIFCTSSSEGCWPNASNTCFNSLMLMVPPPSLSNSWNASLYSSQTKKWIYLNRQKDKLKDRQVDRQTDGCTDILLDGRTDWWTLGELTLDLLLGKIFSLPEKSKTFVYTSMETNSVKFSFRLPYNDRVSWQNEK